MKKIIENSVRNSQKLVLLLPKNNDKIEDKKLDSPKMAQGNAVLGRGRAWKMNRFIRKGMAIAAILCVFLSGCGTSVAQLTEEEEQIIVAYASGAVAKANKNQQQGLTYPTAKTAEEVTEEQQEPEATQEDNLQTENVTGQENSEEQTGQAAEEITWTDALNTSGLEAEYHGYQVKDSYMEGDYFALYAESGKTYLIMNVGLKNTTEQPMECNLFERNLQCSLIMNGTEVAEAMSTILLNDFLSYIKTLEVGAEEETVIIFELPKEEAETVQTLSVELTVDGTTYDINLE